jgi:hypothetical protein
VLGVVVLDETLQAGGPEVFALAAAVVVVIVATAALARGEAATLATGGDERVTSVHGPETALDANSRAPAAVMSEAHPAVRPPTRVPQVLY